MLCSWNLALSTLLDASKVFHVNIIGTPMNTVDFFWFRINVHRYCVKVRCYVRDMQNDKEMSGWNVWCLLLQLNCCGATGPQNYWRSSWYNHTSFAGGDFVPASCCVMLNNDLHHPHFADEIQCQIEAIAANLKPNISALTAARGSLSLGDANAAKNVKTQVLVLLCSSLSTTSVRPLIGNNITLFLLILYQCNNPDYRGKSLRQTTCSCTRKPCCHKEAALLHMYFKTECVMAVQGHPRSLISEPNERAGLHSTSTFYKWSVLTVVLYCRV